MRRVYEQERGGCYCALTGGAPPFTGDGWHRGGAVRKVRSWTYNLPSAGHKRPAGGDSERVDE
jgi:hypothetical protein